jgi:hypothetical protein
MNRYLSWALAPLGIIGLWGVPVDEGVVVMSQKNAGGEGVFIDINRRVIMGLDGVKPIKGRFQLLRLDSTLKGRSITMSKEELLSFLMAHIIYFDYDGPSIPVRQMVQTLLTLARGIVYPRENYRPRSGLSL